MCSLCPMFIIRISLPLEKQTGKREDENLLEARSNLARCETDCGGSCTLNPQGTDYVCASEFTDLSPRGV